MRDETFLRKAKRLLQSHSSRKISVEFHDIEKSLVEGCLARGGRETADVIYAAWKSGSWNEAFASCGLDLREEARKTFSLDETLPWSHIKTGVPANHLKHELLKSGFHPEK